LTEADRRAYQLHAAAQRFKGFQTVHTHFNRAPQDSRPRIPEQDPQTNGGDEPAGRRRLGSRNT
jgi:hypothetical protein